MICTANYCRSPIAEQLLKTATNARFGPANTWLVQSAGTHASEVRPLHELAAAVLTERKSFIDGHQSRNLDAAMLREADLVLTSTRGQRSFVARMLPAAIGRTFTMLQFARLAAAVPPIYSSDAGELGRRLLVEAKAARGQLQPVPPEQDDLPDPMGRPIADFQACATSLDHVVKSMLRPLALTAAQDSGPRHRLGH